MNFACTSYQRSMVSHPTWYQQVLFSGIAASAGVVVTNPIEVVKVRLQTDYRGDAHYKGSLATAAKIAEDEGLAGLWKGVNFAVLRASTYGASRLGMYGPIRDWMQNQAARFALVFFLRLLRKSTLLEEAWYHGDHLATGGIAGNVCTVIVLLMT